MVPLSGILHSQACAHSLGAAWHSDTALLAASGRTYIYPTEAVFTDVKWSWSNGWDQMIQDFLPEIFCMHEEFAAGGKCVFIAFAPLIRKKISCSAFVVYNLCVDYFLTYYVQCKSISYFCHIQLFISTFFSTTASSKPVLYNTPTN